jgi:uncharacterized membrane protein required for colicin V production
MILVLLAAGIVHGITTGAVRQIGSIVGTTVSFLLSIWSMRVVGGFFVEYLGLPEQVGPLVGFSVVFVSLQLGVILLVRFSENVIGAFEMNLVNRIAGSVLGAGKVTLFLSIAFLAMSYMDLPAEQSRNESQFYAPVAEAVPASWEFIRKRMPQLESLSTRFATEVSSAAREAIQAATN